MPISNVFGTALGGLMAPFVGTLSFARRARMFHPEGVAYRASVTEVPTAAHDLRSVAERLEGNGLVRLSTALWREHERTDALGLAIRFVGESDALPTKARPRDQDVLFATIRFPWTTPVAPLTTHVHTFLWNHYYAVSPFTVNGVGRVKLRLRSPRLENHSGQSREDHLRDAVARGTAVWSLEARRLATPVWKRRWEPFAQVTLMSPVRIDHAALRFSPFNDGQGISPAGFIHHIRKAVYATSQAARPKHA